MMDKVLFDEMVQKLYTAINEELPCVQDVMPFLQALQCQVGFKSLMMAQDNTPLATTYSFIMGMVLAAEFPKVAGHFMEYDSIDIPGHVEAIRVIAHAIAQTYYDHNDEPTHHE